MKPVITAFLFTIVAVSAVSALHLPFENIVVDASIVETAETRCGWFVNPTPANAWLFDADGEWIIATQGGAQADGDWPEFGKSQWVKTNVNYGYGCACMKVEVNKADERITRIISGNARPLSACRKDKALKGKEPK